MLSMQSPHRWLEFAYTHTHRVLTHTRDRTNSNKFIYLVQNIERLSAYLSRSRWFCFYFLSNRHKLPSNLLPNYAHCNQFFDVVFLSICLSTDVRTRRTLKYILIYQSSTVDGKFLLCACFCCYWLMILIIIHIIMRKIKCMEIYVHVLIHLYDTKYTIFGA